MWVVRRVLRSRIFLAAAMHNSFALIVGAGLLRLLLLVLSNI
jgi:hypothetical protein